MEGVKRIKATLGYSGIPITQDGKLGSNVIPAGRLALVCFIISTSIGSFLLFPDESNSILSLYMGSR